MIILFPILYIIIGIFFGILEVRRGFDAEDAVVSMVFWPCEILKMFFELFEK